jgi:hypothetical protein
VKLPALVVLAPALLAAGACSRCGCSQPRLGADTSRFIPRSAEAVLLVPDAARLGGKISSLEKLKVAGFVAQLQGLGSGKELVDSLMGEIGIDLRSREGLERAGVAPEAGMAFVFLPNGSGYSVLAARDAGRLKQAVTRLARDRLGAGQVSAGGDQGIELITFSRGGVPAATMVLAGGVALVGPGDMTRSLPGFARLAEGDSLSKDAAFAQLSRAPDVVAYVPEGSALGRARQLAGAVATMEIAGDAVRVSADVPWPKAPPRPDVPWPALEALAVERGGASPYALLPDDAFLVVRHGGDPDALESLWSQLGGASALKDAGFDVKSVLSNLEPGAVMGISLAGTFSFSAGGAPSLNVRRSNPFRIVHVVAAARVADAHRAQAVLEALPELAPKVGAQVAPSDAGGQRVWVTTYRMGEGVDFALAGNTLVAAAPLSRLQEALGRASGGHRPGPLADPALRQALEKDALGFALDLHRLADSVAALPDSAWGTGGFAMKPTTLRWFQATSDLRAVTGAVSARDGAVHAELTLRIQRE